jgi:hypothetical protein
MLEARLGHIRATDPRKFALFTGRDQMQALTGLFARQFDTPNYAAHGGFCSVNMAAGMIYTIGGSFWEFGGPDLDRAKLHERQPDEEVLGCVACRDEHAIARIDAGCSESTGGALDLVHRLRVAVRAFAGEQPDAVGGGLDRPAEERWDRSLQLISSGRTGPGTRPPACRPPRAATPFMRPSPKRERDPAPRRAAGPRVELVPGDRGTAAGAA